MSLSPEQLALQHTAEVIDAEEIKQKLNSAAKTKKKLRIKLGLDPSSPDLHIGHTLVLNKLRDFQELGHTAVLVIGDFTARIGDPSGQNKLRPALSAEEIKKNAKTYCDQAYKVLDPRNTEVVYNSKWLSKLSPEDLVLLCSEMSVARMLERDDFSKRYKGQVPIFIHEFLYPLFQGYDSVALESDIELGGTDQKFNLLVGRDMQRSYGQKPQDIIMMPILEGLDGVQKMSKSLNNAIALTDSADDMFGKIMSLSDKLMVRYFQLLSFREDVDQILNALEHDEIHPMEAKFELALELTARFHDSAAAEKAKQGFSQVHQKGKVPEDIPTIKFSETSMPLANLVHRSGLCSSMKESRRKIQEGAVTIDGKKAMDPKQEIIISKTPLVIQLGKRHFRKITVS
jgi:tyrosyl-tRNA synthetase